MLACCIELILIIFNLTDEDTYLYSQIRTPSPHRKNPSSQDDNHGIPSPSPFDKGKESFNNYVDRKGGEGQWKVHSRIYSGK